MDINVMQEAMRAEFVRAFTNQFGFGVLTASADADAANMLKAAAWAWQASREAVAVQLPNRASEAYRECFDNIEGGSFNEATYIRDVRKAIEAQGLKVAS